MELQCNWTSNSNSFEHLSNATLGSMQQPKVPKPSTLPSLFFHFHSFPLKSSLAFPLNNKITWICAGASFAYQLLYLLDATRFYTPALQYMGLQVRRATGQELVRKRLMSPLMLLFFSYRNCSLLTMIFVFFATDGLSESGGSKTESRVW